MAVNLYGLEDAQVAVGANVNQAKLQTRHNLVHSQSGTVAAATEFVRICRAAGTVLAIEASIPTTIATGGDRTVDVDLQRSTGGGAFASMLSATIEFTNGSTIRGISTGSLSATSLSDGDMLAIVVTVAGSAGNQAVGLLVSVTIAEQAA